MNIDKKTGEVLSVWPEVRTQAFPGKYQDPLPTYVDKDGKVKEGYPPSVVDSSEYEPLGDLVQRLTRGGDVSLSSRLVKYEVEAGADPMEAIRNFDETRREGFDLADAAVLARRLKEIGEQNVEERRKKLAEEEAQLKKDAEDLKKFRKQEEALAKDAGLPAAPPPAEKKP